MPPTWPGRVTAPGYGVPENQPVEINTDRTPYGTLNRNGYFTRNSTMFNSLVGVEWGLDFITPGLSTKFMIAYDGNYYTHLQGYKVFQIYGFNVARSEQERSYYTVIRGPDQTNESLNLAKRGGSWFYMNMQYILNYSRQFGKHSVTGMYLLQRDNWETNNPAIPYNVFGMSGRVTYNYDQRYMAEFNAGYNGSEQFHKDNRFGFFPAVSAGWVVTNEKFLKDNDVLTLLKFRASYGKVGNDQLGGQRFLYRTTVSEVGGYYSQLGFNKRIIEGLIGNEKLSWEVAEKQNYAVDMQLFRDFSLTFDLFREERNNVLISRKSVPVLQGVPVSNLPKVNIGVIHNQGFETEANYRKNLTNGLSFTFGGNFSYNRNKLVFVDEVIRPEDFVVRYASQGYSMGQYFGLKIDKSNGNGYINTQEELDWAKDAYKIGIPRLGDFLYSDENEDNEINSKDYIPIGYSVLPRISYGFQGSVSYKGFDFSFLFSGVAQSSFRLSRGLNEFEVEGYYSNIHKNAWTEDRYLSNEKITYPALALSVNINHAHDNDFNVVNRSFLRLKNIELGYNLPARWLQPMDISRVRVYMNGNNLWTWTKLPVTTVDPEQASYTVVPIMKMVTFGINIIF